MRDLAVLLLHLLTTIARLAGPGGARAVVAESVLVKHQLLILNRSRHRAPNLRPVDRLVAGVCALLMRPGRLIRAASSCSPPRSCVSIARWSSGNIVSCFRRRCGRRQGPRARSPT